MQCALEYNTQCQGAETNTTRTFYSRYFKVIKLRGNIFGTLAVLFIYNFYTGEDSESLTNLEVTLSTKVCYAFSYHDDFINQLRSRAV